MRKLTPVEVRQMRLQDTFWLRGWETNRAVTLETSYKHLKKNGSVDVAGAP